MNKVLVIVKMMAILFLPLIAFDYLIVESFVNVKANIFYFSSFGVYCLIAYFYVPFPDYGNMGMKGMKDVPLKQSDNVNRNLFYVLNALAPGRFFILHLLRLLKGSKSVL